MKSKIFIPNGVCSTKIAFDYENGKMYNLRFERGCNGNLKAIGKLCEGMELSWVYERINGNICGFKTTSCADQLSKAIKEVMEEEGA